MPTADLFPDLFEPFSTTAHFSEATLRAVEKRLSEKNGKPYLKCLVRGKEQLKSYTLASGAPLALSSDGSQFIENFMDGVIANQNTWFYPGVAYNPRVGLSFWQ